MPIMTVAVRLLLILSLGISGNMLSLALPNLSPVCPTCASGQECYCTLELCACKDRELAGGYGASETKTHHLIGNGDFCVGIWNVDKKTIPSTQTAQGCANAVASDMECSRTFYFGCSCVCILKGKRCTSRKSFKGNSIYALEQEGAPTCPECTSGQVCYCTHESCRCINKGSQDEPLLGGGAPPMAPTPTTTALPSPPAVKPGRYTCAPEGEEEEEGREGMCTSQRQAHERCQQLSLRLCDKDEIKDKVGSSCTFLWTSASDKHGYLFENGSCGGALNVLRSQEPTYNGKFFDAACCQQRPTSATPAPSPTSTPRSRRRSRGSGKRRRRRRNSSRRRRRRRRKQR